MNLKDISEELDRVILNNDNSKLTEKAFSRYKDRVSFYIQQLYLEALRISKRVKCDDISESHVEMASDHLIRKQGGLLSKLLGIFGGALIGSAFGIYGAILTTSQHLNDVQHIGTALALGIGTLMIGVHLVKD